MSRRKQPPPRRAEPVTCSFCGRSNLTNTTLFKGDRPKAVICKGCAERFNRLLSAPGDVIAHDQEEPEEVTVG